MKTLFVLVIMLTIGSLTWRLGSARYSLPCPTWLGWLLERDNPFTRVNRAETIIKHLDLQENMVVLDMGCGPGRLTIPLASKLGPMGQVVAMDIQQGMLDRTQTKAHAAGLHNIQYLKAGLGENKLAHNKFDRILLVTVLGEIPNRQAALQELFAALKPGGILSLTEFIFDPHFQRLSTVLQLTRAVGFKEKAQFGKGIAYTVHLEKPQ